MNMIIHDWIKGPLPGTNRRWLFNLALRMKRRGRSKKLRQRTSDARSCLSKVELDLEHGVGVILCWNGGDGSNYFNVFGQRLAVCLRRSAAV